LGTPAGEFYSLQHRVDSYAPRVELVALLGGEEIDGSVSCNKETWTDEKSELVDLVSWFLVVLR
jgi:hypothetical protein